MRTGDNTWSRRWNTLRVRTNLTAAFAIFVVTISTPAQAGQEPAFRLNTSGMGWAQCVYGVEQSLQHTKGVKDAIVDLGSGIVTVIGDPANPPSPDILAQIVKSQRFSIEEIEATLVGRLVRTLDGWQLVVGSQTHSLETLEGGSALEEYVDQTVRVDGVFEGIPGAEGAPCFRPRAMHSSPI